MTQAQIRKMLEEQLENASSLAFLANAQEDSYHFATAVEAMTDLVAAISTLPTEEPVKPKRVTREDITSEATVQYIDDESSVEKMLNTGKYVAVGCTPRNQGGYIWHLVGIDPGWGDE